MDLIFPKNSIFLDGMEVYSDPEGWMPYSCEVPMCLRDADIIDVGFQYETDSGLLTVVGKELVKRGPKFWWNWQVVDEDGDTYVVYTYEFRRIAF